MKNLNLLLLLGLFGMFTIVGCEDDENTSSSTKTLTLDIDGLEDLGNDYAYEGWIMVNGSPVSAGVFNVDADGNLSQTQFSLNANDIDEATAYILTIEPSPDTDPAPSDVHILAGDFSGSSASINVDHGAALGTDFTASVGQYILATPTNGPESNELSGVWWLNPAGPSAGLDLPTLPNGWAYEGWAVVDGVPISTGRFTNGGAADDFDGHSGGVAAPPFPGEDFLISPPSGLTFPVDLSGDVVVISVEPSPDNSTAPFLLKPLVGMVPANAAQHTAYEMSNNASVTNPTGNVSR